MIESYEIYLSPKVAEVLTSMVSIAEKNKVSTVSYINLRNRSGNGRYQLTAGDETKTIDDVMEDAILVLKAMNLIVHHDDAKRVFLTRDAIEWNKYYQRSPVSKWFYRARKTSSQYVLTWGGMLIAILATSLAISLNLLQIIEALQLLGYLPKPP